MTTLLLKLIKQPLFWAIVVAVAAIITANIAIDRNRQLRADNGRLAANQTALLTEVETYKTKAGDNAASVQALTLERDEFKRLCTQQASDIKALGVRLKDAESYASMVTATTVEVETVIRDTVYVQGDTVRLFNWSDDWVNVSGRLTDNTVTCNVASIDTLYQVVHRVPKRFLFFKYGVKAIRQEVVSRNPHTKIKYAEFLKIK